MADNFEIKKIIKSQKEELLSGNFAGIKDAEVSEPIPMLNEKKMQEYWFTAFLIQNKIRGFAITDNSGNILIHGLLAPNVIEIQKQADKNYLSEPPKRELRKIRKFYPGYRVVSQTFSFDTVPQKWAWRLIMENKEANSITIFISPYNWYEKKSSDPNIEG